MLELRVEEDAREERWRAGERKGGGRRDRRLLIQWKMQSDIDEGAQRRWMDGRMEGKQRQLQGRRRGLAADSLS